MPADRKTSIVTGAASGIGRAMAMGLIGEGYDVIAVDRNAELLGTMAAEARGKPGSVTPLQADLTQPASFDMIANAALAKNGRIDVLVNVAGIGQASVRESPIRFWEVTPEHWQRFLAVNATAVIMMARAVVPHMIKAGSGRVVTVTTSLGTMVREGYLLYGASKAAAEAAMAVLAADLQGTGVTCNVLVPGGVTDTPLVGTHRGDRSKMLQPRIMVPPLLWLVSDEAQAVSARRFVAADWNANLPGAEAAEKAGVPIAWLSIARMPIEPV